MEATINHNQNAAECITHVNYWGKYVYHNICNGQIREIPFGIVDYAGAATVIALVTFIILVMTAMTFFCISLLVIKVLDIHDSYKRERQWKENRIAHRNSNKGGGD